MTKRAATVAILLLCGLPQPGAAGPAGTLDRLVEELDLRLDSAFRGRALSGDDLALALRRGQEASLELVDVVRKLLLGRLQRRGARSVAEIPVTGSFDERRTRAGAEGFELLLDLELTAVEGYLHLRGLLVPTDRSLWRDAVQPQRGALHHVHARVRVDAEIRGYLGSLGSGSATFSPREYPLGRARVVALAVADLEGDGRNELVALEPHRAHVLRFRGRSAGFAPLNLTPLAPPWAQLWPRRPMGSLVVADLDRNNKAELLIRTSEMEQGAVYRLDGKQLAPSSQLAGYPLAVQGSGKQALQLLCQAVAGQDLFDAGTLAGTLKIGPHTLPQAFYGLSMASTSRRSKQPATYLAVVDDRGKLQLYLEGKADPVVVIDRVGVAFDLLDLDDDGAIEVVTTGGEDPGAGKDRIVIYRIDPGTVVPRTLWRSANLEGLVTALGHGDLDGDGRLELVAALLQENGRSQLVVLN